MAAELPRNAFSVAKEGKVFEQKKILQPLLGTHEGMKMGCIISPQSERSELGGFLFMSSGSEWLLLCVRERLLLYNHSHFHQWSSI